MLRTQTGKERKKGGERIERRNEGKEEKEKKDMCLGFFSDLHISGGGA